MDLALLLLARLLELGGALALQLRDLHLLLLAEDAQGDEVLQDALHQLEPRDGDLAVGADVLQLRAQQRDPPLHGEVRLPESGRPRVGVGVGVGAGIGIV